MNKNLSILYLLFVFSFCLAKNFQSEGGWVPTKQTEECVNNTHTNMMSLCICIRKDNAYLEKIISHKLKKIGRLFTPVNFIVPIPRCCFVAIVLVCTRLIVECPFTNGRYLIFLI